MYLGHYIIDDDKIRLLKQKKVMQDVLGSEEQYPFSKKFLILNIV